MNKRMYVPAFVFILVSCVSLSGASLAQGPINNAQQFQEKAIKSALKGSKSKGMEQKSDSMIWVDTSKNDKSDDMKKEDNSRFVNVSTN